MTIASEITRLQGAKATARTSIINKGVDVPVSASVEDYHTYIDQIQQGDGGVLAGGLKLYNNLISSKDGSPVIKATVSWIEGNKYYGCSVYWLEGSAANSLENGVYTYRKINTTNDMSYTLNNVTGNQSGSIFLHASNPSFWKSDTNMKIIFFEDSTLSTNSWHCYQAIWDYKNTGGTTNSLVGRGTTTNLSDYNVNLDGYTQVTTNEWVKSVTPNIINNNAYIYITLK